MTALFGRSLAVRVYVFVLACVAILVLMQVVLFMAVRPREIRERIPRLNRGLTSFLAAPAGDSATVQAALDELAHGGMDTAIVDVDGTVLMAAGRALPAVDRALVRRVMDMDMDMEQGTVQLDDHVMVVRLAGALPGTALVSRISPPTPRPTYVAPIIAVLLIALLAMSIAFARSLTRPLGALRATASRFGSGDLQARNGMTRSDEIGDVSRAFDDMARRITALVDANRALTGAVSHELRTPMARIRVALELAAEDPSAVKEMLAGVQSDLGELERLVDDILTTARLGAATAITALRVKPVLPAEIVARARAGWQQRHGARPLVVEMAAPLPRVQADAALLRRALDNLLDNAAKYAPKDSPVTLHVIRDDDSVWFSVIDRGPGMSDDEIEQAFTPFWRSDADHARNTGGVGLGLALVRQIAQAHKGGIDLARPADGGMRATLRIPAAETN